MIYKRLFLLKARAEKNKTGRRHDEWCGKCGVLTLNELLEYWARWKISRSGKNLGFAASRLNVMMGGGVVGTRRRDLPYGIDPDSIGSAVDRAVCALSPRRREVIELEFCRVGTQKQKAAGMRPPIVVDTYKRLLRNARQELAASRHLKPLLKRC